MSRRLRAIFGLLLLLVAGGVRAEMIVELRDGRRIVLPVTREEVARIRFTDEERAGDRKVTDGALVVGAKATAGRVLRVGPDAPFRLPSEAAAVARDGDVIEIAAGYYRDVATFRADDLTIRGVGGRPVIDAAGGGAEGKAVWVIRGARVHVAHVELVGSRVPDRNGAGIRAEGTDLELVDVVVHDNEMGILVAADFRGTLRIADSEFYANGTDYARYGVPPGHQIYVSGGDLFVLEGSYVHDLRAGHGVKSRARRNILRCNRIEDGDGGGSYLVDIAEAAPTRLEGNLLIQGARAENRTLVAFGAEGGDSRATLELAFDTLISEPRGAVFVANHTPTPARLAGVLLVGRGRALAGPGGLRASLAFEDPRTAGLDADAVPHTGSPVIDRAAAVAGLMPDCRFRLPRGTAPRTVRGQAPDVGALEGG